MPNDLTKLAQRDSNLVNIILCILKSIAAWAILTFVGTNLIGFVVRGILWSRSSPEAPDESVADFFRHETRRMGVANGAMTVLSILVTAAYLFAVFHFWNVWLAVAASVSMATRLPDLVWKIRSGERHMRQSAPKGPLYVAATFVMLATWPLIWYSLCMMP